MKQIKILAASKMVYALLKRCVEGENITSSDRLEDLNRKWLKANGFIIFDRADWKWKPTDKGHRAVKEIDHV